MDVRQEIAEILQRRRWEMMSAQKKQLCSAASVFHLSLRTLTPFTLPPFTTAMSDDEQHQHNFEQVRALILPSTDPAADFRPDVT